MSLNQLGHCDITCSSNYLFGWILLHYSIVCIIDARQAGQIHSLHTSQDKDLVVVIFYSCL